jgi:hypothetical protein
LRLPAPESYREIGKENSRLSLFLSTKSVDKELPSHTEEEKHPRHRPLLGENKFSRSSNGVFRPIKENTGLLAWGSTGRNPG